MGDVTLAPVENSLELKDHAKKSRLDIYELDSIVTSLAGGSDVSITAGGGATLIGTDIDSGGKVRIAAENDVVLAAAQDIYSYERETKSGNWFRKKQTRESETRVTNAGTDISASGDIEVVSAAGNLVTAGSRFASTEGNVALKAVKGDIFAGTYIDIFRKTHESRKSYLGGLFSSNSRSLTDNRFATGTAALAGLDLTLVSGGDTTLVGTQLKAGGRLSVETGGDFSITAAISSMRKEYFSHKVDAITMTTITENSFKEIATAATLIAGGGIGFDIRGKASLTLYDYAGVDSKELRTLYPDELLKIAGLELIKKPLADEYFYDKKVALSPAFKALVALVVSTFIAPGIVGAIAPNLSGALLTAAKGFTSSLLVGSLDGAVSGRFDIGAILKDAAFAGATAGLTSAVSIKFPEGSLLNQSLLGGFGNGQLTMGNILNGALDGVIRSGLSSAFYGTDFGTGFTRELLNTVVSLAMADVQGAIGKLGVDLGFGEGSLPSMLLHGAVGCAAASATGDACAAGAAAAVASSLYAGALKGTSLSDAQQQANVQLIGAIAGYFLSGGDSNNVNMAASIAVSAIKNNRQLHRTEVEWIHENADAFADWMCRAKSVCNLTREQSLGILAAETLDGVSDAFGAYGGPGRRAPYKQQSREFIELSYKGPAYLDGQTMFGQLDSGSSEYRNTLLNANTALSNLALYDYATRQSLWPQGQSATMSFLHEALADFADRPKSMEAQAFISALASSPNQTRAVFAAYGASQERANGTSMAVVYGLKKLFATLPEPAREAANIGFAEGVTGRTGLTTREIENAVLNGTWGSLMNAPMEELVVGDLLAKGMRIMTLPSGQRVLRAGDGKQYNDVAEARLSSWRENGRAVQGTNLERMASGRAPIGNDGQSINLHHMIQTQTGPIAEVTQTFHRQNSGKIHINTNDIPSGIDRANFDAWRASYWRNRASTWRQ
jgi:filamentous hemagglutinin